MFERKTIGDYIYEKLLDNIIQLHYEPGEKLSEGKLAEEYGVSRTPVHNAIVRLEREGMVTVIPQSGTFVSHLSIKKAQNICDIRLFLEIYAVKIAALKITNEQIADLKTMFEHMESLDKDSPEKSLYISVVDTHLHNAIYELCGNSLIPEIINRYLPEIQRIKRANIKWKDRKESTQIEMKKIFHALGTRNVEEAAEAMEVHISNIKTAIGNLSTK